MTQQDPKTSGSNKARKVGRSGRPIRAPFEKGKNVDRGWKKKCGHKFSMEG